MTRKIIATDRAPTAIGPYSQAIQTENWLFISGQIPLDPATNSINGDVQEQTRQVLENIKAILTASGMALSDVVKTTIFIKRLGDFAAVNEVYREYFHDSLPARSTIEVSGIPKGALVEIEAIALRS